MTTFNINQGTVRMSGNSANSSSGTFPTLNSASVMNVAAGATVTFATSSSGLRTFYNLNGAGNVNHTNNGARQVGLNVGAGNTATFGGQFGGAGSMRVIKTGAGTQIFNRLGSINTSVRDHTVLDGTLLYAYRDTLYGAVTANWTASNLRVGSAGTLGFRVGGTSEFTSADLDTLLTNLATSDTLATTTAGHGMNAGATLLLDTSNAAGGDFSYGGAIADTTGAQGGTRGLLKWGANELTLSGANTYTGPTRVTGGSLHLDGGTNNSASFEVTAGADFIQSGTDWTTDLFHSTGAGSDIDVAQLADSSDNDSVIRYNLTPNAGISTINLTAPDPFANIGGGLTEWKNEWTIEFNLDSITSATDFQTLTLFSSSGGYSLANLAGLRMITYDGDGNLQPAALVQHNDTVYLAKSGNVVASFTAVFSANSVQLVFGSARAIPEPSTLGLVAMALALLRRRLRPESL